GKMTERIAGIILAAGLSKRMGRPKALLQIGGETFLARIVRLARAAGLDPLRIVVSEHRALIEKALPELADHLITNDHPELGQLRSLRLGLRSLSQNCTGAMMFLVDHPKMQPATLQKIVRAFKKGKGEIILPVHAGRRGHPVIFGRAVFEELLEAPLDKGARHVVRSRPDRVCEVEVDDAGILADIDTPGDYEELSGND
ncbi:MAG TPA: nucleotidyltransferase family protein, partial [Acidobacteriota bacterium]|nr:nucleotidyltransferase family protein [Acidobacteriota bacterium]